MPAQPCLDDDVLAANFVKTDPQDYVVFQVWLHYAWLRQSNGKSYVPFTYFEDDYLVNYLPKRMNIDVYEKVFTRRSGVLSTEPLT